MLGGSRSGRRGAAPLKPPDFRSARMTGKSAASWRTFPASDRRFPVNTSESTDGSNSLGDVGKSAGARPMGQSGLAQIEQAPTAARGGNEGRRPGPSRAEMRSFGESRDCARGPKHGPAPVIPRVSGARASDRPAHRPSPGTGPPRAADASPAPAARRPSPPAPRSSAPPSCDHTRAVATPIPEVPPVIKARLAFRSIVDIPSVVGIHKPLLLAPPLAELACILQSEPSSSTRSGGGFA